MFIDREILKGLERVLQSCGLKSHIARREFQEREIRGENWQSRITSPVGSLCVPKFILVCPSLSAL